MTEAQTTRIRLLRLRNQALLDQLEEEARELQPRLERLAECGPDGSREDAVLSKAAATYLCAWLDAAAAQRETDVVAHGMEPREEKHNGR